MEEIGAKKEIIEEICQRIENLLSADHLSDDQKLLFAREALKIISKRNEEKEIQ